jgi:hypothetical protein
MKWIPLLVAVLGAGFIGRSLFPKTVEVVTPPRIVTHYDTVQTIDTAWVTRLVRETKWDTVFLERVVTAAPETLRVCPELRGLTTLTVGQRPGDSTVAQGFALTVRDTLVLLERWQTQWWTPGPLRAFSLDVFPPRVAFWEPPKAVKGCGFFCQLSHYGVGGAVGWAGCELKNVVR